MGGGAPEVSRWTGGLLPRSVHGQSEQKGGGHVGVSAQRTKTPTHTQDEQRGLGAEVPEGSGPGTWGQLRMAADDEDKGQLTRARAEHDARSRPGRTARGRQRLRHRTVA